MGMYQNFVKILQNKGLTPYKVSKGTGISGATLTSWKNGTYTPKLDKLTLIAEFLGVDVTDITGSFGENRLPILGQIACGSPLFAEENIEDYVQLPASLFGNGDFYMLRANGYSMIDVGISSGDFVLIRRQNTAEPGEIVVALVEEEATLKRYFPEPERRRIRLHPENKVMDDIYVSSCEIQGIAVKVLKDL